MRHERKLTWGRRVPTNWADKLQFKSLYKMFQNALNRHWPYVYFTNGAFCFHVSFLCFNLLIINSFEG